MKLPKPILKLMVSILSWWAKRAFQKLLKKQGFTAKEGRVIQWIFDNVQKWAEQMSNISLTVTEEDKKRRFRNRLIASRTGKAWNRKKIDLVTNLAWEALADPPDQGALSRRTGKAKR